MAKYKSLFSSIFILILTSHALSSISVTWHIDCIENSSHFNYPEVVVNVNAFKQIRGKCEMQNNQIKMPD